MPMHKAKIKTKNKNKGLIVKNPNFFNQNEINGDKTIVKCVIKQKKEANKKGNSETEKRKTKSCEIRKKDIFSTKRLEFKSSQKHKEEVSLPKININGKQFLEFGDTDIIISRREQE